MNKPDAPFYLGVNHTTKNSDKSWFKASAMGVNKLNSLMKTMAERAGLDNSHLTNHSARKRMIQTLNDKDIPPSHIMQLSGHRNVQSINNYSHVSQEQQKSMSRILSGSTSMVQTETHSLVETRKHQSPTPTAMVGDYRHNSIFDFLTCSYILHSNEFFGCLNFMLVLSIF